jgi:hypothetical protein
MIPYSPTDQVELVRVGGDDDAEGRTFYKAVLPSTYLPNAFAAPLSFAKRKKVFFSVCAEMVEDSPIGPAGTLALVVFYRWSSDSTVSVAFDSNQANNTSTASIYRIPGHPVVKGLLLCHHRITPALPLIHSLPLIPQGAGVQEMAVPMWVLPLTSMIRLRLMRLLP